MNGITEGLRAALPELDEKALERFEIYYEMLLEWNEKMNLTTITDPEGVIKKHFLDSLCALPHIKKGDRVIDVDTGAGFPGVPLLILRPDMELTLADSLQKRIGFLEALLKALNLKAACVHGRAEDLGREKAYRERFNVALSRAVAPLPVLLELTTPFIKVGGVAIAYKGDPGEELLSAKKAAFLLKVNLSTEEIPSDIGKRCLVLSKKLSPTPALYPRKAGTPAKKPL